MVFVGAQVSDCGRGGWLIYINWTKAHREKGPRRNEKQISSSKEAKVSSIIIYHEGFFKVANGNLKTLLK